MSNEIKDIPELPKALKQAINDNKLAIFTGAGVSRFVGCDGWDVLAEKLLVRCRKEGLINYFEQQALLQNNDKIKIITICNKILKDEQDCFINELEKSLKDSDVDKFEIDKIKDVLNDETQYTKEEISVYSGLRLYKNLKNLGNIFLTTNADRYFDKFFHESNVIKGIGDNLDNLYMNDVSERHKLYKIHGCVSTKRSLVFSMEAYIAKYSNPRFNEFIRNIFGEYNVLFVGYGLTELELLKNIKSDKQHFHLKGFFDCEDKIFEFEKEYLQSLKIELIAFSKERNGHEQLKNVIDDWNKKRPLKTQSLSLSFDDIDKFLESPDE